MICVYRHTCFVYAYIHFYTTSAKLISVFFFFLCHPFVAHLYWYTVWVKCAVDVRRCTRTIRRKLRLNNVVNVIKSLIICIPFFRHCVFYLFSLKSFLLLYNILLGSRWNLFLFSCFISIIFLLSTYNLIKYRINIYFNFTICSFKLILVWLNAVMLMLYIRSLIIIIYYNLINSKQRPNNCILYDKHNEKHQ